MRLVIVIYLFLIGMNLYVAFNSYKAGNTVKWYTWFVIGWLLALLTNTLIKLNLI
jgi:hypothetical protein